MRIAFAHHFGMGYPDSFGTNQRGGGKSHGHAMVFVGGYQRILSRPVCIVRHSIPEYFRTYRSGDTPIYAFRSSTPLCGRFLLSSGFAIRRSEKECRATHRSPQRFVPGPAHSRWEKSFAPAASPCRLFLTNPSKRTSGLRPKAVISYQYEAALQSDSTR